MSAEDPIAKAWAEHEDCWNALAHATYWGKQERIEQLTARLLDECRPAVEAAIRADERDRLKARLEESAAWYDRQQEVTHADTRLDPEDVAQVLRGFALVEEARGGE